MTTLFNVHVRNMVVSLRRHRVSFATIVDRVNARFPDLKGFDVESAQAIWRAGQPKDLRTKMEREAVSVSLAGPAWSHPNRSAR